MNFVPRAIFASVFVALFLSLTPTSFSQEVELRFDEYEELLNGLLRTRFDEEKAFVSVIIARIEDGSIPERVVETSYKWVLNERPNTNYPFIYFEKVLRIQSQKLGIDQFVPVFDYGIYQTRIPRSP